MNIIKVLLATCICKILVWDSFAWLIFSTIEPDNNSNNGGINTWSMAQTIAVDEKTLPKILDLINNYLRVAIGVVCLWVLVYGGFRLISAQWDEKRLKEANSLILWAFVGIVIATMWFAVIKIIVNLF